MSELKEFVDNVFIDIRNRVESEYKHHLTKHFQSISSDISLTHFTSKYGEIKSRQPNNPHLVLPKPIEGRWWIHSSQQPGNGYDSCNHHIYDNYGQCFIANIRYFNGDMGEPSWRNVENTQQKEDGLHKYPLPDCMIDFVKKQGILTDLNIIGDIFHQIMFTYAI
jgi:hypothetical protein